MHMRLPACKSKQNLHQKIHLSVTKGATRIYLKDLRYVQGNADYGRCHIGFKYFWNKNKHFLFSSNFLKKTCIYVLHEN